MTSLFLLTGLPKPVEKQSIELDAPSPALGKAVATSVHQAVTDPYFRPLEKLAEYMGGNPDCDMITIEQMTKWAPDNEFPTCFVWDTDGSRMEVDNAASPWAMEMVVEQIRVGMEKENPRGLLYISTFQVEGEKYWLGYLKIPRLSDDPTQIAGVFFCMDRYLNDDVPRLIDELVSRQRFPLVDFQLNDLPQHGESDGSISIRILNEKGKIYFQHGRNFDEKQMIYSESRWYPNPIVCMQEGWDLQVFSANATPQEEAENKQGIYWGAFILTMVLVSLLYWLGVSRRKKLNNQSTDEVKSDLAENSDKPMSMA
jgi:hypothetical protein